ncbi:MAG: metal-sensing transcriptional repressor [Bacilli bacterium]|nr:metal-sensing transcriptional repressor [Bacilli bacterium]
MKADHKKVKHQLSIAKGQLDGISKMVDNDDYCIHISNQLLATIALLKKVNLMVIKAHLESCVKQAQGEEEIDEKLEEITSLLERMSK